MRRRWCPTTRWSANSACITRGFFDPGFGAREAGGAGSRIVLEVRSHEVPFILEHGQIIGRFVLERLTDRPTVLYGAGLGSNYQRQGLKLSKHFRTK